MSGYVVSFDSVFSRKIVFVISAEFMIKFSFFAIDFIEGYFFCDGFSFAVLDAVVVDGCEIFVVVFGVHTESSFEMIHHLVVCL